VTQLRRHLAAVWFADIVGYTTLSERNEGEAVRVARSFQRAAREVVERFGGRVVKFLGDGALAEFPSSEMAVRSAHALTGAVSREAEGDGLAAPEIRLGVHVGDVAATEDGDLYGDGVNVASRLQAAAVPGEVWVSEDVWRQLRRRPELRFEPRGAMELKGIGHPVEAYAVQVLDEAEWTPPSPATAASAPSIPVHSRRPWLAAAAVVALAAAALVGVLLTRDRSGLVPSEAIAESAAPGVAVVPFSVNDPELERWREGMVDLLSTNLDGAAGLRAIDSRTVLARWRDLVPEGQVADLPTALEVARRSGGKYGLVGSAVSSGASMRLTAELYDLGSGEALGRPQVEGSPDSIFGLVDRLSIQILALILEEEGGDAPRVDLASVTTSSLPALKSYLEAEGLARRGDFQLAIPAYEAAIEADSTFALAHYRLGDAYGWSGGLEIEGVREEYAAAKRFVDRLPARDADLLEISLAYANARDGATQLAREATQRYPDDPVAWYLLGEVYFHLPYQSLSGPDQAREAFTRAVQLDPTYLPAEIHLIDLAFRSVDQAAADSLLRRFDPATSGSEYGEAYALGYALAFGDSTERSRALQRVRTVPFSAHPRLGPLLRHPRFARIQAQVLAIGRARPEFAATPAGADVIYGQALLNAGEIEELARAVESGEIRQPAAALTMATAWFSGIPISEKVYEHALSPEGADATPGPLLVTSALWALDRGDRATARRAIEGMRAAGRGLLAGGDSTAARQAIGIARLIEARDAMLRGESRAALSEFEALYREIGFDPAAVWAARILEEQGEIDRSITYLEQLGPTPILGLWLGSLYEKADRRDDALEAYGWITLAWEEADAALQPRVSEARQAIARLEGLRRG
jgi:class 3 adenylate cyclase/tetratricopeptide (TPR) repeat protein